MEREGMECAVADYDLKEMMQLGRVIEREDTQ